MNDRDQYIAEMIRKLSDDEQATVQRALDEIGANRPADLAGRLAQFLVEGPAEPDNGGYAWNVRPSALASMFADLAARFATMPDDLSVSVSVRAMPGYDMDLDETGKMAVVDGVAAALTPGVQPSRQIMSSGAVHYDLSALTPAGLHVNSITGVEPTDAEREQHRLDDEAREQARQEQAARRQARMVASLTGGDPR